nr:hypothetical protein [Modestobacter sp. Leaf380]
MGQVFDTAPGVTLTSGLQAQHSAVVGNRLPLALDHELATRVSGGPLAGPALVCDVSIGQSTLATQHVRANLSYRGLLFSRQPLLGDTLHTTTTVQALRENGRRPGRPATGLALLRITTTDQLGRAVLDYRRCAMLLCSPDATPTGHVDELPPAADLPGSADLFGSVATWDVGAWPARPTGPWAVGRSWDVLGADLVSSAPELARLTGNLARVHHDASAAGGARLVYGGHTIGIALHHLTQAVPGVLTVAGWHSCDHTAPVHEGDVLTSTVTVESVHPGLGGLTALGLDVATSTTTAHDEAPGSLVLRWRPVVLVA